MCVLLFVTCCTEAPVDAAEDEVAGEKAAEEQMPQEAAEEEEGEPDDVDAEDQPSGQQCDMLGQILELPSKLSGSFGRLFVAKGTNQSYIQQKVNGMLSLLVSISQAASPRHSSVE